MLKLMFIKYLHILFVISSFVSCMTVNSVSVNVSNGTIVGSLCSVSFTRVAAYLGIPYSQPPIGDLRWRAPVAYNTSYPNNTLNATKFSSRCYQFNKFAKERPPYSEDW
jgi:carboxylesterase type B